MKLSKILRELSRRSQVMPNSMLLHECADKAQKLERNVYDDVRNFHLKFGHPAPAAPDDTPDRDMLEFRIDRIEEETRELVEAIRARNLAAIAAESVDLIYVVVGTLVALGLPLLPFWREIHKANMIKVTNPTGGKPLKPEGWKKPDTRQVLYTYKQGLDEDVLYDPDGPEMG
jgi:predicted HAD superfamily Cof-like phosphohydrolase